MRIAVLTIVAVAAVAGVIRPAPAAADIERLTCREGGMSPAGTANRRHDLIVGPISFIGIISRHGTRGGRRHGLSTWKVPVIVDADRRVTVSVARADRDGAWLLGRARTRRDESPRRAALTYVSCPASRGVTTGWPGALLTKRTRLCLHLRIEVDGEPPRRVTMPLGRPGCGAATQGTARGR